MGSMFFERYSALCKEHNETPNSVAKIIGASSGSVTAWKKGTDPRNATLTKIADFFGVTTDYLLGKDDAKKPTGFGGGKDVDFKAAFFEGYGEDLPDNEKEALWEDAREYAKFKMMQKKQRKD